MVLFYMFFYFFTDVWTCIAIKCITLDNNDIEIYIITKIYAMSLCSALYDEFQWWCEKNIINYVIN